MRRAIMAMVAAALAVGVVAAGCGASSSRPTGSPAATGGSATSSPVAGVIPAAPGWPSPQASDFVAAIDNPWFPLTAGRRWTSRGTKDGKPTVDTYTVTGQIKRIEGVTCSVVRDVLTVHRKPIEATWDWYAQDAQGNVWYFGEDTKEFDAAGKVTSTAGSWQAGVNGAAPGVFMPADPTIGAGGYQEYYRGQALDRYKVISLSASITVPYGSFKDCLETKETTALEPGVVDHKYYVKGIGQVAEETVMGPKETSYLAALKQ